MKNRYCPQCQREVRPIKKPVSGKATVLFSVFYLFGRIFFTKPKYCPICGCKTLKHRR